MPLPLETIRLLHCYLKTERPLTNAPEVFVSLKGRARGTAMTPAGLRSLFQRHRSSSGIRQANPHRFRHTFGSDMIRAGVSLPALMRLMGHAHIHTTLLYIQLTPQESSPNTPAPSRRSPSWSHRRWHENASPSARRSSPRPCPPAGHHFASRYSAAV